MEDMITSSRWSNMLDQSYHGIQEREEKEREERKYDMIEENFPELKKMKVFN